MDGGCHLTFTPTSAAAAAARGMGVAATRTERTRAQTSQHGGVLLFLIGFTGGCWTRVPCAGHWVIFGKNVAIQQAGQVLSLRFSSFWMVNLSLTYRTER